MNSQRFREPAFIASATACCLLLLVLLRGNRNESLDIRLTELEKSIQRVEGLMSDSHISDASDDGLQLHKTSDAEKLILALGTTPSAEKLAECVSQIDGWIAVPEDRDSLQRFKAEQLLALRAAVAREVTDLHKGALASAGNGSEAIALHGKASQVLALYPVETSDAVLNEAKKLSSQHSDVGAKIESIRRRHYNHWAITRVEETIAKINANASSFKTSDNQLTIDATLELMGEVDPNLLEPVAAQLYNYAIEQAKANVNSAQQLELGKRLMDPAVKRRTYGDF